MNLDKKMLGALKKQEEVFFRESSEDSFAVRDKIKRIEFIVHPGWGTVPKKSQDILKKRKDYIDGMDERVLRHTLFFVVLGGHPPEERRSRFHSLYKAVVSNSVDEYLGGLGYQDWLKDLMVTYYNKQNPQSFREFMFSCFNYVNSVPSDIGDLYMEGVISHSIKKRTNQVLEFPACLPGEKTFTEGGPISDEFKDAFHIDKQGANVAQCIGDNIKYVSHQLEISYWGDYGDRCVLGVKNRMDDFFDRLGRRGLRYRSRIVSELCVFKGKNSED